MRNIISFLAALVFGLASGALAAEPVRLQCSGEFYFSDGQGEGFDGAYTWSFYVNLDEEAGVLVSAPMFPQPVPMRTSPQAYSASVQGEWCFKPYGPSDDKNYCAVGTRTLQIDRDNLSLVFSYTPQKGGKPLGALRKGRCQPRVGPAR
jgi:hypothetical protein